MQKHYAIIAATLCLLVILTANAHAEHIFDTKAHAQYPYISKIESGKWTFAFDGKD